MKKIINKHRIFGLTDDVREWIVYGICILCLALFASAAYGKLADHETFATGLLNVSFIGAAAIYVAWLVPLVEILIVVLLIVPGTQRLGLYCFVTLMAVFTGYIVGMMLWAENLPCHCNLIIEKLSWRGHIWFNAGFITLSIFALWLGGATKNQKTKT